MNLLDLITLTFSWSASALFGEKLLCAAFLGVSF